MKRKTCLLLTLMTVGTLGLLGGTTTAHAATWHNGTPKILRGTYVMKQKTADGYRPAFTIKKHTITLKLDSPKATTTLTKAKYRKTGRTTYLLKGGYFNSGVLYVKATYGYAKNQKRIQIKNGFNQKNRIHWTTNQHLGWFYRK